MRKNAYFEKACEHIKNKICSGQIEPGEFLSAPALASEIGVSRSPVRDALRYLEREGLVVIVPRLGAVAASLTPKQAYDLLGLREALEVYAVGLAATLRSPQELGALTESLEKMRILSGQIIENPGDTTLIAAAEREDIHFHMLIITASRNDMIKEKIESTQMLQRMLSPQLGNLLHYDDEMRRTSTLSVFEEHVRIYEGIRDQDPARARAAMTQAFEQMSAKLSGALHRPVMPNLPPLTSVAA